MLSIDEVIKIFRSTDTVIFKLEGVGEKEFETIEFKDAVEELEKTINEEE